MTPPRPSPAPHAAGAADAHAPVDLGSRARNAFLLGSVGLVLAGLALVLAAASFLRSPGSDTCRTAAWDSEPNAADLPAGWAVATSQVGMDGLGVSLSGTATDASSGAPTIYVTVSCYGADAVAAVDRSRTRVQTAGQSVTDRADLGDGGYGLADSSTGALAVHFRVGALVAYAATQGTVAQADLDTVAGAFDTAMRQALGGGAAGTSRPPGSGAPSASAAPSGSAGSPAPAASSPGTVPGPSGSAAAGSSPGPAASQAAPDLVAMLPAAIGGTTLTRDSALGADVLGDDAVSRALQAALRKLGASTGDLRVAQAYDETGTSDLYILLFSVSGVSGPKIEPAILDTWLSAGVSGVTTKTETIAGKQVTTVDYGDQGATAYVRTTDKTVVIVQTTDAALAAEAIGLLP